MKPQLRSRNGKWSAVVEVWQDGRRKVMTAPGGPFSTQEAAEAAGWQLCIKYRGADAAEERARLHESVTLAGWVPQWLELAAASENIKTSTVNTYRWRFDHWILPYLGSRRMADLTMPAVTLWLDALLREKKLSHRSRKAALTTLGACLEAAKERGFIKANPARGIPLKLSKARQTERKAKAWSQAQANALLQATQDTQWAPAWHLGLSGGLRRGEILGLRWEDVDWDRGRVWVCRNLVSTPNGLVEGSPKSGEFRWVPLPANSMDALRRAKVRQEEAASLLGTPVPVHVVASEDGSQGAVSSLQRALKLACRAAGIPDLGGPHVMRHTCASTLLRRGASIVQVAKHLGHADPRITAGTYSHFLPEDEGVCAAILQTAMQPEPTQAHTEAR